MQSSLVNLKGSGSYGEYLNAINLDNRVRFIQNFPNCDAKRINMARYCSLSMLHNLHLKLVSDRRIMFILLVSFFILY